MELLLAQGDDNLEVPHVPIPLSKNTANHNAEKFLPTIFLSAIGFWNLSTTLFALFLILVNILLETYLNQKLDHNNFLINYFFWGEILRFTKYLPNIVILILSLGTCSYVNGYFPN